MMLRDRARSRSCAARSRMPHSRHPQPPDYPPAYSSARSRRGGRRGLLDAALLPDIFAASARAREGAFVGEAVAMCIAPTRAEAEDIGREIELESRT